jgi:hypothetical protein
VPLGHLRRRCVAGLHPILAVRRAEPVTEGFQLRVLVPQPTVVPLSRPEGTVWPFFSALNSASAWELFHSTASPAFGV